MIVHPYAIQPIEVKPTVVEIVILCHLANFSVERNIVIDNDVIGAIYSKTKE